MALDALAAEALAWTTEALKAEEFETYMLKVLQAYAKLQRFAPKPSKGAKLVTMARVKQNVRRRAV